MPRTLTRLFPLVWVILLTLYIMAGIAHIPLHGDESTLIYMGRDFYYQFVEQDSGRVMYQNWESLNGDDSTQQHLRLLNGTVSKYLYGFIAWISGYEIHDINQQWNWGSGWDWNHSNGHVPANDLLIRSRAVSALFLAAGIPVMFALGWKFSGQIGAYLASLLYALHPALLLNGRRAMMEGTFAGFSLFTILAGILVLQKRHWWTYILLGILSGLTVASKHTGVVTVAAVFATCGLAILWKRQELVRHLLSLVAAGFIALGVFYLLNPAWWGAPVERAREVLEMRNELLESQQATFGTYADFGAQLTGFFRQTFSPDLMYAEVPVDDFIIRQQERIQQYEQSGLAGWQPGSFAMLILALIGTVQIWRTRTQSPDLHLLIAIWIAATIILTLFLTPLEWQRYYLPLYPPLLLLVGGSASFVWESITTFRQKVHSHE